MNNIEIFKDIKDSSKIELKKILKERQVFRKEILFNEKDTLYNACLNPFSQLKPRLRFSTSNNFIKLL